MIPLVSAVSNSRICSQPLEFRGGNSRECHQLPLTLFQALVVEHPVSVCFNRIKSTPAGFECSNAMPQVFMKTIDVDELLPRVCVAVVLADPPEEAPVEENSDPLQAR